MNTGSEEKYAEIVRQALKFFLFFVEALVDCYEYDEIFEEVKYFLTDYLDDAYDNLKELKDNTECIEIQKKKKKKTCLKKRFFFLKNCSYSSTQKLLNFVKLTRSKVSLYQKGLLRIYLV